MWYEFMLLPKSGLKCVAACQGCGGDDCNNAEEPFVNDGVPAWDMDFSDQNVFDIFQDIF